MYVCVLCATLYPGRAGQAPLFYGSRSNTARALITQNIPCRRSPARSCDEELRPMRRINQGNVLVLSPPIGHVSLFFPSCVFSLHDGDQPSTPPLPELPLQLPVSISLCSAAAKFCKSLRLLCAYTRADNQKRRKLRFHFATGGLSPERQKTSCSFNALT